MRVLKSLLLVLLLWGTAHAQDTSTVAVENTLDSVFHPDKKAGVTWHGQKVPDSTMQRLRRDDAFWYANADLKKPKPEGNNASFAQWLFRQTWVFNLLWAFIVVSFIAVILLFLMKSNITLFRKAPKRIGENNMPQTTEDIFSVDYNKSLKEALTAQDFQAATRLHYLHTLTLLSSNKLIQYKEERTNQDYLQQLHQTSYYGDFKKLTHHFEYAWYGKFVITSQSYQIIEQDFTTFKQGLGV